MSKDQLSFEKLEVWKKARALTKSVYILTRTFPDEEKYNLVTQIRRATVSVTNNIAEGTSRTSFKDQARFTEMAYGSLLEVLNLTILASDLDYITDNQLNSVRAEVVMISRQLSGLKNSQMSRINKDLK